MLGESLEIPRMQNNTFIKKLGIEQHKAKSHTSRNDFGGMVANKMHCVEMVRGIAIQVFFIHNLLLFIAFSNPEKFAKHTTITTQYRSGSIFSNLGPIKNINHFGNSIIEKIATQ
eukprot:Mycagemm_TRINITY_DN9477_c0_g2::TRINITY_DN9477_c0_g2_i1::g.3048::m.3048 type:complete len:115 gc:universal TRINITY_DN9477_c0_g2_i1:346-2(-)